MILRPLLALALAGMAFFWLAPVRAEEHAAPPDAPSDAREVRAWLLRIHEAASHRNFQGTFVVSSGGSVSSARIAHYCEGTNQFERSESLDGQARLVYRHNDEVHTLWPARHVALVEQRNLIASFPALLQAGDDHIVDFYDVRPQGTDRVAGHEANVLMLKPKDGYRFGYRLWADKASGLLLRSDVIGERGDVLETSAFSDVMIGVRSQPESVLLPSKRLEGFRVLRPVLTPTRLESEGWAMRQTAPGFRQVSCVKRPMDAVEGAQLNGGTSEVLQSIYSDGLTYVSVFIEPFDAERHTHPILASVGSTQTLMTRLGDWWVTVVGDVPSATLRAFANALERRKVEPQK